MAAVTDLRSDTRNGHKGFETSVEDYSMRMTLNPSNVRAAVRSPNPTALVSAAY